MSLTNASRMSIYHAADWGARVVRVAIVSQARDGTYAVDRVPVTTVHASGFFSVLTCVDGTTHVVLTAFLRLVHHDLRTDEQGLADGSL
ncbi:MAG TPA: hypothetical protein VNL77_18760 [Roseiflexaceae bacterium]|nr:hypothetical protein [Roseiflexaceae bacterium]